MGKKLIYGKRDVAVILCILFFTALFIFSIEPITQNLKASLLGSYVQDSPRIMEIAKGINESCPRPEGILREDDICKYYEAVKFMENVPDKADDFWENLLSVNDEPEKTLVYGNDCDGKAVLFADLLMSAGIEDVYFVSQGDHICVMAVVERNYKFWNCLPDEDILFTKKVV